MAEENFLRDDRQADAADARRSPSEVVVDNVLTQSERFEHLRAMPSMANRKFVLTSTNPERVLQATPAEPPVYEIIGKPYDMQVIVNAVERL